MIIREITSNPQLIESFDFFNDFKDTHEYLIRNNHLALAERLKQADTKYWLKRTMNYKNK